MSVIKEIGSIKLDSREVDDEVRAEVLEDLVNTVGVNKFIMTPNYQTSWLKGPEGFACSFPSGNQYAPELYWCEKFRVMGLVEVKLDENQVNEDFLKDCERRLRMCIPTETKFYPRLNDQPYSGWSPCLGKRGSSIGLYDYRDESDREDIKQRYFIVCHSSLPDESLQIMNDYDAQKFSELRNGKKVTQGDMFNAFSVNDRFRDISIENVKRLIFIAIQTLGLSVASVYAFEKVKVYIDQDSRVVNNKKLARNGEQYRCSESYDHKRYDMESLNNVLQTIWPRGALITPSTTLSMRMENEAYAGFPLGKIIFELHENEEAMQKLKKNFSLVFELMPRTLRRMDVCTVYNTYHDEPLINRVEWFSNCAKLKDFFGGCLVQDQFELGYRIYFPSFLKSVRKKIAPVSMTKGVSAHLNMFPVLFPYRTKKNKSVKLPLKETYFEFGTDGCKSTSHSKPPKQLLGDFEEVPRLDEKEFFQTCLGKSVDFFIKNYYINVRPLKVFLSTDVLSIPRFEIKDKTL